MNIAIVILNWNGKQLLKKFLPALVTHTENAEIYIADNASTDDSIAFLKETYPQLKRIEHSVNKGFAKGYNDALKHVNADIYCLFNSDVEVSRHWLQPIPDIFNTDKTVAVVQPKLLDYKQKHYFEYAGAAGGYIDKFGYPFCRGRIFNTTEADHNQYNDTRTIFWASGACFFVRKTVFEQLGGFDEDYFAHQEEIDFCWRAQHAGFNVLYTGKSTVYHVGGATLKNSHPRKTFLNFRNSLFSLAKNLPRKDVFPIIFLRLILDAFAGARFLLQLKPGHLLAVIKAHFSFFIHLKKMLKKRRPVHPNKKYYHTKSVVWSYFIRKKKYFHQLE